jgi:hypothetical protein
MEERSLARLDDPVENERLILRLLGVGRGVKIAAHAASGEAESEGAQNEKAAAPVH